MADNSKTEITELEKIAETLEIPTVNKDGEKKSIGTPENKETQDEKGDYRTVLRKDLRDKIDLKRFPDMDSFWDFASKALDKDLVEKPEPETNENWEKALAGYDEQSRILVEHMREAGVSIEQSNAIYNSFKQEMIAADAKIKAQAKAEVNAFFNEKAKSDSNYKSIITNGMSKVASEMPELFVDARNNGLLDSPFVAQILYMIGKTETESTPPIGGKGNNESSDPMNPLGYK